MCCSELRALASFRQREILLFACGPYSDGLTLVFAIEAATYDQKCWIHECTQRFVKANIPLHSLHAGIYVLAERHRATIACTLPVGRCHKASRGSYTAEWTDSARWWGRNLDILWRAWQDVRR